MELTKEELLKLLNEQKGEFTLRIELMRADSDEGDKNDGKPEPTGT